MQSKTMSDTQTLRIEALKYFEENEVHLRMQDALNVLFRNNPSDVNGFVSVYFEELASSPTVTRIIAEKYFDNCGQPAITTKIFCSIRNKELCVAESHVCVDTLLLDSAKVDEMEAEEAEREREVDSAINLINNDLRELLVSANPKDLRLLEQKIYDHVDSKRLELMKEEQNDCVNSTPSPVFDDGKKGAKKSGKGSAKKKGPQVVIVPDRPKERSFSGHYAVTALSQALSLAGASTKKCPLYQHLLYCFGRDDFSVKVPQPVITLSQSGKASPGKSNIIKEYMIVSRPDMLSGEAVTAARKIQDTMLKTICSKSGIGIKSLHESGALCPTYDKPEQGLDAIAEAAGQAGYEMGKDFFFILNSSAQDCFDYEKGKYEVVSGMLKGPDDMADYWLDLCSRYESIVGIIDPLRCEEQEQWNKICAAISDHCLIISEKGYSRPGILREEEPDFTKFATSGLIMKLEGSNTTAHIAECAKKMTDLNNVVIMAAGLRESNDTTIVDIATACQAHFLKMGPVCRGERIAKYNRLIDIENELGERRAEWDSLAFPSIPPKVPTPTPELEENGEAETANDNN